MLCESSSLKKETLLSTRLFNSARFMKVLKGTVRKSQISRKLMQSGNRPALPQSMHCGRCAEPQKELCLAFGKKMHGKKCIISLASAGQHGNAA